MPRAFSRPNAAANTPCVYLLLTRMRCALPVVVCSNQSSGALQDKKWTTENEADLRVGQDATCGAGGGLLQPVLWHPVSTKFDTKW